MIAAEDDKAEQKSQYNYQNTPNTWHLFLLLQDMLFDDVTMRDYLVLAID
jgi:hypothetical protein